MTGDEIRALRRALDLTARKLGQALGIDQATVLAWERGELFPTKRHVTAMRTLVVRHEEARAGAAKERDRTALLRALADPELWTIVRKVLVFEELRAEVERLAASYPDPAEE